MVEFNVGSSKIFGSASDVEKWNAGVNFWGKDYFKFDGGRQDKANLLTSATDFVKILTGRHIPVRYAENADESFTDGQSITISSIIVPESLDSTIGLVLHEASHCAITDFGLLKDFIKKIDVPVVYHKHIKFIKGLFNWVEDRRIDCWAYNQAPGYEQYYDALYDRYFFTDKIDEVLKAKAQILSEETFRNYEFFIINCMHPSVTMTELKGLPEIKKIINLQKVSRWRGARDCLKTAYEIYDEIIKHVSPDDDPDVGNLPIPNTIGIPGDIGENGNDNGNSGDGSGNQEEIEITGKLKDLINQILEEQRGFLSGEIEKETITPEEQKKIRKLIKSEVESSDYLNGKVTVEVIKKIKTSDIHADTKYIFFDFEHGTDNMPFISEGLAIGTMLGRKLKLRDEEKTFKTVNQRTGKINKRGLYSASYDNERLFYNLKTESYRNIAVHISIDLSGSMHGTKWENTLVSVIAITKATSMIKGVRTQISLRYSVGNVATVFCFYDSEIDNIRKMYQFQYMTPIGGTPEGICFDALAKDIMKPLLNNDTLFINFSDGQPGMLGMNSAEGVKITKKVIEKFRGAGMSILSYFISDKEQPSTDTIKAFTTMYGAEAHFIDVKSMMQLTKTINSKFLKMGK